MSEQSHKVSRRGFVAGSGAAVIGVGLAGGLVGCTPDSDEQNQAAASGDDVWIPTTCNLCFNNCSILAHRVDGVVVELTGNPDSPIGNGHICGKGASGVMQLYDPNRITKPMKRTNPKKGFDEDPCWEVITWDEAYSLMDEKISTAMAESTHAVSGCSMVASQAGSLIKGTAIGALYGAIEGAQALADICGAGVHQVSYIFTGAGNAMPDYDLCDYIIQFGTQAGTATRHGFNMTVDRLAERRAQGLRLINFDPHMGAAGEQADLWVPILPGTDACAAMAMSYVLVHELNLVDIEYLKNRTNGPALVDTATQRIIRASETNKALYMDATDNTVKPYDECQDPVLEGTFDVEGKTCTTAYSLYKEHLKTYTPEYQETITTVPAATIRQVAKEFGEAAKIGETITIDGKSIPLRPVAADCFSGISRHKHAMLSHWAIMFLNVLVGSCNSAGGFIGFDPACNGWTDESDYVSWRPAIWEEDGFIEDVSLMLAFPGSYYRRIRENDYTPTTMSMMELQPLGEDGHFYHIAQSNPEMYHTEPAKVMFTYSCNPIKWWGNFDEQAEVFKNYEYVIGIDLFLNDSSYFYDLILPEASYLERTEPLPHFFLNHRVIGSVNIPWAITSWQKVVEPKDDAPSSFEIFAELADRTGKNAELIGILNMFYRVKEEYSLPYDKKLDIEAFTDSVLKSVIDEEHGFEWMKEHGVYTHPRDMDEMYIWADDAPGKVPLYWDFMLEAKEKVEAKVTELDIPWETDDYQPLPDWKPCVDFEITDPEFDILPVYYTDAINTDSWLMENPWINEINEANPYAYTIEINKTTAETKGLASGDEVRLLNKDGVSVEGKLAVSECIHPACVSVIGGHWGTESDYMPIAKGKGSPIVHLISGQDPDRLDHICAAFDQCVRIKIEKI